MNTGMSMERRRTRCWWLGVVVAAGAWSSLPVHAESSETANALSKQSSGQVYVSPSQVRIVQEKLHAQGRNVDVDGVWDEDTMASIRDYQKSKGLAVTGQLDTSLLSALEIGDVLQGKSASNFLGGLLTEGKSEVASSGRGVPLYVSPVHVAQVQQLLKERGHYSGAIDGAWGPATAKAANEFRQAEGLEANVGLDIGLLRALNEQSATVTDAPAAIKARTAGVPLQAGKVAIRALQRQLAKKGHEAGAVDGVWGENTRQAVREFQKDKKLEPTGTLTLPTLAALGIDMTNKRSESQFEAERQQDAVKTEDPDAVATRDTDTE